MSLRAACLILALLSGPALAGAPRVATDIAPVHSLAALVMAGVGEPALILPPGASPHGYALRPGEAAMLQDAELVFRIGGGLTPWLDGALATLAGNARVIALIDVPGTVRLPYRDRPVFAAAGMKDDPDHDPSWIDPHAWLDPENARLWLGAMAEALADIDPDNAALYRANAQAAAKEIDARAQRILIFLVPHQSRRFVVFHDAWQYFEARFGLHTLGAISPGDASRPGPARLAALRAALADSGIVCVLAEPQFDPRLVDAVAGGTIGTAVIDPLGADIPPGADFYGKLLDRIAGAIGGCR